MTTPQPGTNITNICYGDLGTIDFDYNGTTVRITEPMDVMLVDANEDAAARWIMRNYGFLLANV